MLGECLVGAVLLASIEANVTVYGKTIVGKGKKHWHQVQPGGKFGKH